MPDSLLDEVEFVGVCEAAPLAPSAPPAAVVAEAAEAPEPPPADAPGTAAVETGNVKAARMWPDGPPKLKRYPGTPSKRSRVEEHMNPFYPPLRPPTVLPGPLPPPKRARFPDFSARQTAEEPPDSQDTVLRQVMATALQELLDRVKPDMKPQVPKMLESNRRRESAVLRVVLDKYTQKLPLTGGNGLCLSNLLEEVLQATASKLKLCSPKPQQPADVDQACRSFLQRLYALIIEAQDEEERLQAEQLAESAVADSPEPGPEACAKRNEGAAAASPNAKSEASEWPSTPNTAQYSRQEKLERRLEWRERYRERLENAEELVPRISFCLAKQDLEMFE